MHRPLLRAPLWSIADTLCKSKFHQHVEGPRNVADKLEFFRPLTTSLGHEILGYGEGSSTNLLQTKIVDALRLGERSRASHLLLNLGHGSHSLRADDFVYILRYCATTPDALFVMETWRIMEEKEIGLNNTCYLLMMRALCKGSYLEEASNLIKFTGESHGIYPTLPVYNCFLGACAKMQSMTHANLCLELMESRRVGKDETTYIQLLKIAAWQQNLSAVHEIWKDYIKHYSLSIFPLQMFIWSVAKFRDLKSAYETLQHMVAFSLGRKPYITANSKGMLYSSKLDIPIPSNDLLSSHKLYLDESEDAVALSADTCMRNIEQSVTLNMGIGEAGSLKLGMMNKFQTMPSMKILGWAFKDVMHACEQTQNGGLAEQLMLQLKKMQQMNLKPYDFTLAIVSIECSKALELDYAEALLDHITKCSNTRPFNDQPERAVKMLDKMKQLNLKPDIRTYELLFSLFGNVNAPYEEGNMLSQVDSAKRINAIERDMAKNGVQHSYKSMNYLLKSLGAEGMIREQLQYLRMADNQFLHKDNYCETPIYNTVLHSLVKAGESNTAIEIFKNMKLFGLSPNAATYHIMIDCCVIIRCFKSACAIVSMMVRSGFYPEAMAYTVLFKVLLECEDFDEVLNMFDRVSSEGIQLDLLSYNTILQQAWLKGRINVIEFIIEQMHQQKIQPDPSTCHYVFTGYVDRGFHSTAIEALQVLSMRMLSEEEDTLQEKKTKFEDLILTEDSEPESKILQLFKDSEYLGSALLNLRWCALAGYSISWSPDQSPWARRLSANYNTRERTVIRSLVPDPMKQEPLLVENVPDPLAGEQTWPTEAEMTEADQNQKQKKLRKRTLPRGTSEYQAAWIVDDTDEEDSDSDNGDDDDDYGMVLDQVESGLTGQERTNNFDLDDDQASLNLRYSDDETENDSVMMEAENVTMEQLEDEIKKIKEAHAEDEEYPDEVDTPIDVPARKRFAKYRGLKSFRTSSWDPKESLPPEYARIFAFDNFARTQKHVLKKALEIEQGNSDDCVPASSYVRLHIKEVPVGIAYRLCEIAKTAPLIASGLLQHESKMSVLHFSIKKHDSYSDPIKTKEELVFHVGFRQFVARPIFSTDSMNTDKHKMERFLHAGRFSMASIYAPITFPPLPLIVLKSAEGVAPAFAAVGSLRRIDPDRIILKKIILTGYPQRVSKLKAAVRYMFHSPEDVRWFKPVEVWTKCGRRGRIKEPVGTHGAMKCVLNGILQQNDTVCMSLYKRAFPKWPEHRFPMIDA